MRLSRSHGFTLIELMIVVAIIGILAAIAVPQYQGYVNRTQLTRLVSEVSVLKNAVEEHLSKGRFSDSGVNPMTSASLGFVVSNLSNGVLAVNFPFAGNGAGAMTLGVGGDSNASLMGILINLNRTAVGSWSCNLTNTPAAFSIAWVPAGCLLNGNPV